MRILEIQNHLRAMIPTFDSSFVSFKQVQSLSVAGDIMTVTCPSHGLKENELVSLSGVINTHALTLGAYDQQFGVAEVTTTLPHDLSTDFDGTVKIQSDDINFNGDFELLNVGNRKSFSFKVPVNTPSPTQPISLVESEDSRFNGLFNVTNVTTDTFDIDEVYNANGAVLTGGQFSELGSTRITSDTDLQRFRQAFTSIKSPKNTLVCIAGTTAISRSREVKTDFAQELQYGDDIQVNTQEEFSVYAFIPISNSKNAVKAQEYCRNELKKNLILSLNGYNPQNIFSDPNAIVYYNSDTFIENNTSLYIHEFNFSTTYKLSSCDSYKPKTFPLNKITVDYQKDGYSIGVDSYDFTI